MFLHVYILGMFDTGKCILPQGCSSEKGLRGPAGPTELG